MTDYPKQKPASVAITGGIGSGKSYVCSKLRQRGIDIYDCDSHAKTIIATSNKIRQRLTKLIGKDTFLPDGRMNKASVANFLLASKENNDAINAIVHPAVAEDFLMSDVRWMECAILYESGFDRLVEKIIAVVAPEEVREERIMLRDGVSRDKARDWIERQMPQQEVAERADYTIVNDGLQDVDHQINEILKVLL